MWICWSKVMNIYFGLCPFLNSMKWVFKRRLPRCSLRSKKLAVLLHGGCPSWYPRNFPFTKTAEQTRNTTILDIVNRINQSYLSQPMHWVENVLQRKDIFLQGLRLILTFSGLKITILYPELLIYDIYKLQRENVFFPQAVYWYLGYI